MAKKKSIKTNSNKIKASVFDKVIFILSGVSTLIVFMLDWFTNVITLELKWQIILGLVTVLSGFFTVISFCFDKKFNIIENKIVSTENTISNLHDDFSDKMIEKLGTGLANLHNLYAFESAENSDFKEYAQKKVDGLIKVLDRLLATGESDVLDEIDYYEKLNQLADKIENDQLRYSKLAESERDKCSQPIIWALTCFNEDEWGEEVKFEDEWSDRLEALTAVHGIAVERICILSDDIQNFIKIDDINELNKALDISKHLKSFMGFLLRYYKADIRKKYKMSTKHYAFFANESSELARTEGFFGICLSSGEKHIVKGDCVAETSVSTAKIVFKCDNLYNEFEIKKKHTQRLEKYISGTASAAFKTLLKSKNIDIL